MSKANTELTADQKAAIKRLKTEGDVFWKKTSFTEARVFNALVRMGLVVKKNGPNKNDYFQLAG